ncbi:type II toxin-antitoxin system VapC family toxin [Candidatus Woesearchaeota archaeon]|nr:type II toxin-antitoxin system VapC family toxin [Candidatus Woesearchaeota archaeon]
MKALDTTFLIDLARGKKEAAAILEIHADLVTTQINMFEFIRGLMLKNTSKDKMLVAIRAFGSVRVLPLTDEGILEAAEISSSLINDGLEIDDADCLAAGICKSHGVKEIITRDIRHFQRIKGIKSVSY